MGTTYDFIIVGGGSAGCVLANRLSADPKNRVCLVEAGGEAKGLISRIPIGAALAVPGHMGMKINNWAFNTVPQAGLNGRIGYQPRGKGLGGSSLLNAMIYIRGNPKDYDAWAADGCEGWAYDDLLPYFKRSENFSDGESKAHGGDGPLQVRHLASPHNISADFIAACTQTQIATNTDFNSGDQYGAGYFDVTQFHKDRPGERCSAAAAYLHPIRDQRPNLRVITHAHAQRVIIENNVATGVEIRVKGKDEVLKATREVVLSAGSFQSPQLLMLSGIGDAAMLKQKGITPVIDLPKVGQNLQDHVDFTLSYGVNTSDVFGISAKSSMRIWTAIGQWRRNGTGILTSNFAEAGAFFGTDSEMDAWPDIQLHFAVTRIRDHARKMPWGHGMSCHVCVLRPKSRGHVTLSDSNPMSAPQIDPNFFSEEEDMMTMVKGVRKTATIMDAPALSKYIVSKDNVSGDEDDATLTEMIRNTADTIYHPVGTCRMGSDATSVVDCDLRVRGIKGLRVADASIMPTLISGNTNASSIMIGEKASDLCLSQAA